MPEEKLSLAPLLQMVWKGFEPVIPDIIKRNGANMKLSQEQQKVVYAESKKMLVIAPAGSGKTRVLTSRIQHLIEDEHVSPYEILCITFTRKGAGEMKKRLSEMLGSKINGMMIGTIHGVALNLLQRFGEIAGLKPGQITVYGQWEETFLLKEVAMEIGFHTGHKWKKVKKGDVDRALNLFYTTGQMDQDAIDENTIMKAFFARCRENNALTYGTILTTFAKIIPDIVQYLPLRHILIDETQDNDALQWSIVNDLCKYTGASMFAVGDPNQSIFAFRGADPDYLIRNKHLFDVYHLRDNYRSSANIVEAANRLISHNPQNISADMVAIRKKYGSPVVFDDFDSSICTDYLKSIETVLSNPNKNTAILARNHWMLEKLSRLLTESGIKHQYVGKTTTFIKSEEFRRFHAFLNLIVNPMDNFSFLLIKDYLGLSAEEYGEIRLMAVQNSRSHFQEFKTMQYESNLDMDWLYSMESSDFSTAIDWMKDIPFKFDTEPIFDFIYSWMIENYSGTIDQYLDWLATFDSQDEIKEDEDGLRLMTFHAAKGLEWPTVIILGLNENIFPGTRAIKANELTEELRLCYVAVTRAEDQLILTSRPLKKDDQLFIENPVSRFVGWAIS